MCESGTTEERARDFFEAPAGGPTAGLAGRVRAPLARRTQGAVAWARRSASWLQPLGRWAPRCLACRGHCL